MLVSVFVCSNCFVPNLLGNMQSCNLFFAATLTPNLLRSGNIVSVCSDDCLVMWSFGTASTPNFAPNHRANEVLKNMSDADQF